MKKFTLMLLFCSFLLSGFAQMNGSRGIVLRNTNNLPIPSQTNNSKDVLINESFADVTTLETNGWSIQNLSAPVGSNTWFQGNPDVFNAYEGAASEYIAVNYNSTSGAGTINNWLVTPEVSIKNGDTLSFWTRSTGGEFPDRLQVRMSTNGNSTNVGTDPTTVGDFTTLLVDINENYGTYPADWTNYKIIIEGLSGTVSGRFAFRYFVEDGGPSGSRSDFIGLDLVQFTQGEEILPVEYTVNFSVVEVNGATNGSMVAVINETNINSGDMILEGSAINFTASPAAEYGIKEWKLNGQVIMNGENLFKELTYSHENLSENIDVTVEFALISSVETHTAPIISVYPNPFENNITINCQKNISRITISNLLGQEVMTINPNNSNVINTESLQSGIYLISIDVEGQRIVRKISKR